jgi:aspartyl-tRNA(Asn)/glutamyl-tRNA(Gln) amidotransferase subunit C
VAVTREDVLHVARLARLELSAAEVERFTAQLNGILAHVEELAGAVAGPDAAGGDPADLVAHGAPLRADEPGADPLHRGLADIAAGFEDGFFTVPRLPALDADALPPAS